MDYCKEKTGISNHRTTQGNQGLHINLHSLLSTKTGKILNSTSQTWKIKQQNVTCNTFSKTVCLPWLAAATAAAKHLHVCSHEPFVCLFDCFMLLSITRSAVRQKKSIILLCVYPCVLSIFKSTNNNKKTHFRPNWGKKCEKLVFHLSCA